MQKTCSEQDVPIRIQVYHNTIFALLHSVCSNSPGQDSIALIPRQTRINKEPKVIMQVLHYLVGGIHKMVVYYYEVGTSQYDQ